MEPSNYSITRGSTDSLNKNVITTLIIEPIIPLLVTSQKKTDIPKKTCMWIFISASVVIKKCFLICERTAFIHIDEYYLVANATAEGKLIIQNSIKWLQLD